jgi:hypothetical protein
MVPVCVISAVLRALDDQDLIALSQIFIRSQPIIKPGERNYQPMAFATTLEYEELMKVRDRERRKRERKGNGERRKRRRFRERTRKQNKKKRRKAQRRREKRKARR